MLVGLGAVLGGVEFACALGASATMKLGCTPGVFTMAEARAFLAENRLDISSH